MKMSSNPEEMNERELLLELNRQLGEVRFLLRQIADVEEQPSEAQYKCEMCGVQVAESEREDHAKSHGLPEGADFEAEFSQIVT